MTNTVGCAVRRQLLVVVTVVHSLDEADGSFSERKGRTHTGNGPTSRHHCENDQPQTGDGDGSVGPDANLRPQLHQSRILSLVLRARSGGFDLGLMGLLRHVEDAVSIAFIKIVVASQDFRWRKRTLEAQCSDEGGVVGLWDGISSIARYRCLPACSQAI